jgi:5-methylcytosine-specific restriction enzyme subunit McrC
MSGIPIQNLYYLLLYAWEKVPEGIIVDVGNSEHTDILDLLSRIFEGSLRHVLRRGLFQSYRPRVAEFSGLRGRLLVAPTARRMLAQQGRTICEFDELSEDNLPNQIIRATILGLSEAEDLDSKMRHRLRQLDAKLAGIRRIDLAGRHFGQVQLQGSNGFYGFLLNLCRLIYDSILMSEEKGEARFREFARDRLPDIYERFVFGFYKRERPDVVVTRDDIRWDAQEREPGCLQYLPRMRTDISLRDSHRCLVIDTKFYEEALRKRFNAEKIISGHLYQVYAYLKNLEPRGGVDALAEAMLLYPAVNQRFRLDYSIGGHRIRVCTVDLAANWKKVSEELLELAS